MQKDEVVARLRETADLLEITEASAFEVMAYRNGGQALEDWYGDLDEAVAQSSLTEIPAIGKGLSQVISDLVRADTSEPLDRVRALVPPDLPRLLRVRGLGPKRVRTLWKELGIESPADLRQAAGQGRVQALRGFGAKTVERILSGLDYLEKPRAVAAKRRTAAAIPAAAQASGRLWAGTSGYSYPEWKGSFYAEDTRPADFLAHYASRLPTVEINNTFYRFPSESVIEQWQVQTPAHFRFAVKAHRRITHQHRLSEAARDQIGAFVERCGQLGNRLGCILFQLPPDLVRDDARLDGLLDALPAGPRYAVEFRHESWFVQPVEQKLRDRNVACVASDSDDQPPRQIVTADFVYTRLRRSHYAEPELSAWDEWFAAQVAAKRDVLVYLKHDEAGLAPDAVIGRWLTAQPSPARKALAETLAKPTRKSSRRRKTG